MTTPQTAWCYSRTRLADVVPIRFGICGTKTVPALPAPIPWTSLPLHPGHRMIGQHTRAWGRRDGHTKDKHQGKSTIRRNVTTGGLASQAVCRWKSGDPERVGHLAGQTRPSAFPLRHHRIRKREVVVERCVAPVQRRVGRETVGLVGRVSIASAPRQGKSAYRADRIQ